VQAAAEDLAVDEALQAAAAELPLSHGMRLVLLQCDLVMLEGVQQSLEFVPEEEESTPRREFGEP
jgi:hypothetical protein